MIILTVQLEVHKTPPMGEQTSRGRLSLSKTTAQAQSRLFFGWIKMINSDSFCLAEKRVRVNFLQRKMCSGNSTIFNTVPDIHLTVTDKKYQDKKNHQ